MLTKKWKEGTLEKWCLAAIILLAAATRLIALEQYPRGTNTDEVYGAYIAWGMLTEGIDDRGYHFPVYFVAWGSGMNALYPYLGMLLFRLFGPSMLIYRLPQAVFGILAIVALAVICKELIGRRFALLAAFALAVNPWHIQACRFGLESNLAPNMCLIAVMFLVLGLKKKKGYLIPAAVFFGLTLYSYAITWMFLPVFFVLCLIFCWKWVPKSGVTVGFIVILFCMALPLLLFLMVNLDLMPEIRTAFFSIPKLTGFRGEEMSIAYLKLGIKNLFTMVMDTQADRQGIFMFDPTGAYYYFTVPFLILGVAGHAIKLFRSRQMGKWDLSFVFMAWLISGAVVSVTNNNVTMIHANMIHIIVIVYGAYGIYCLAELLKRRSVMAACVAFYTFSFALFGRAYVQWDFPVFFGEEPYEAVARAKEIAGEDGVVTIFQDTTYKYPHIMWEEKWDIRDYVENVVYNDSLFFAELREYRNYRYISGVEDAELSMKEVTADGTYVLRVENMGEFMRLGFQLEQVNDSYAVAAMTIPSL